MTIYTNIVSNVPQLQRGQVWCRMCESTKRVDSAGALRCGWPKCCGETMTIDSPEWRAAYERQKAQGVTE